MDKFRAGDRVILTDRNYCATKQCPVWGSTYMCVGTIIGITVLATTTGMANIQWDNGTVSSQFLGSLTLHNEEKGADPNRAFLLEKKRGR